MALSNLSKTYMIQGTDGPVEAKRPSDEVLRQLREASSSERFAMAITLAEAGFTIDAAVDVNGWNYWKTMEQRRRYGYTWVPAGHMANIIIAPGLWMPSQSDPNGVSYDPDNPPTGAILVPASEKDDPNYVKPEPVTPVPPPADAVAAFGPPIEAGEFAGCFTVATENTATTGTHATKYGVEYVYVVLRRGFTGKLALWVPVE